MKKCNKCKQNKPLSNFCKDSSRKDGYEYICKQCKSLKTKKYHIENIDTLKDKWHKYYSKNKERLKACSKERYHNNLSYEHERSKVYRENNKETIAERKLKYKENNREYCLTLNNLAVKRYRKSHPEVTREQHRRRRAKKKVLKRITQRLMNNTQ